MKGRSYTLIVLVIVYVLNFVDRQILTILQEPIKAEFGLADWQLGLMTGVAFALFYTTLGLPIARYVDRTGKRVTVISLSVAFWSLATALCGAAQTFVQLLIARVAVGVGEAGCTPPAMSLISSLYPRTQRGMAMGIYALGIPIGSMIGLMLGGWIGGAFGWRWALIVVGLPGLGLALLLKLTVREPRDPPAPPERAVPARLGPALGLMLRKPSYRHLLAAGAAAAVISIGTAVWIPSFFARAHGMSMAQIGFGWGLASGVAGAVGSVGGGRLGDMLGARHPRWAALTPMFALLAAMPIYLVALSIGNGWVALMLLVIPLAINGLWITAFMTLGQSLAPAGLRATVAAFGGLILNVVGIGMGPLAIGGVSDFFAGLTGNSADGLRWALLLTSILYLVAAAHFYFASRTLSQDLED